MLAGRAYAVQGYRPRIEGLFSRIERWRNVDTGQTHWRTITAANVTTVYGATANSRIADPSDPARVFSWLVCASHDDAGNAIVYEYQAEDGAGVDTSVPSEQNRIRTVPVGGALREADPVRQPDALVGSGPSAPACRDRAGRPWLDVRDRLRLRRSTRRTSQRRRARGRCGQILSRPSGRASRNPARTASASACSSSTESPRSSAAPAAAREVHGAHVRREGGPAVTYLTSVRGVGYAGWRREQRRHPGLHAHAGGARLHAWVGAGVSDDGELRRGLSSLAQAARGRRRAELSTGGSRRRGHPGHPRGARSGLAVQAQSRRRGVRATERCCPRSRPGASTAGAARPGRRRSPGPGRVRRADARLLRAHE